jgi:hypothetical protein
MYCMYCMYCTYMRSCTASPGADSLSSAFRHGTFNLVQCGTCSVQYIRSRMYVCIYMYPDQKCGICMCIQQIHLDTWSILQSFTSLGIWIHQDCHSFFLSDPLPPILATAFPTMREELTTLHRRGWHRLLPGVDLRFMRLFLHQISAPRIV